VAASDITADLEKVRVLLGKKDTTSTLQLLKSITVGETKQALEHLHDYISQGGSVRVLAEGVLETLRKALLIAAGSESLLEQMPQEELAEVKSFAQGSSRKELIRLIDLFNKALEELRDATIVQLPIEIAVIEASLENSQEAQVSPTESEPELVEEAEIEKVEIHKPTKVKVVEEINKTPASPKSAKSLKKVLEVWPKVLAQVKELNSSLEMFLRQGIPVDLEDGLLILEFSRVFHKTKVEEKKYREAIEGILQKLLGQSVRIKGLVVARPEAEKKPVVSAPKEELDPSSIFGKLE
jgi:DNA polymerase III gamma/tau subunit